MRSLKFFYPVELCLLNELLEELTGYYPVHPEDNEARIPADVEFRGAVFARVREQDNERKVATIKLGMEVRSDGIGEVVVVL